MILFVLLCFYIWLGDSWLKDSCFRIPAACFKKSRMSKEYLNEAEKNKFMDDFADLIC